MSDTPQPTFLVSAYSDPIIIRIHGKANYLNCNSFRKFIEQMLAEDRHHFLLDFSECNGMDSTFLGILAGTALELRKQTPPGELALCRLSERNQELICNLGLQNLLSISGSCSDDGGTEGFNQLQDEEVSEAKSVLQAHENLTAADQQNVAKFQDVIAFLKNQVEHDEAK